MKILSWNVNGIRAVAKKGFAQWLAASDASLVGVQEVRATEDQLPEEVGQLSGWSTHFVAAERKGYSGVGLFSRVPMEAEPVPLGDAEMDSEGRLQLARLGDLWVVNGYFPNGNGKDRDNSRIPFKLDFYQRLYALLEPERAAGRPILVMGDLNTAHQEIDLARPKANEKTSGFCPEERAEVTRWLEGGWTDTFRHFYPDQEGAYSWWSQRFGVRKKNIGWRLDYVLASPGALPFVKDAFILSGVEGSDHCPVGVEVDGGILGG